MGYWRIAIPVWIIASVASFLIAVETGHSAASGLGWAFGWLTVVIAFRWLITSMRPFLDSRPK